MKIAFIHETGESGATRCVRDLIERLEPGHDCRFFPAPGFDTDERIRAELRRFQPDVVNCHSFYSHLWYRFLAWASRRYPTCYTVHDPRPISGIAVPCWDCRRNAWCYRCPLPRSRLQRLTVSRHLLKRVNKRLVHARCAADMVLAPPSAWIGARLAEHELGRFRSELIPYGIDLDRFRPVPVAEARRRLGLPIAEGAPLVLHIAAFAGAGQYSARKGLAYLAGAMERHVLPRFPEARLGVVGEDVAPNRPWVLPLGSVPTGRLPDYLAASSVFATPTLADNLPYTILEAMGCGRAVVASAVGGVAEQVVEGETGRIVPPRDEDALGRALVDMLADPDRLGRMGAAGRRRAEDRFGMDRFIQAYEDSTLR